MEILIVIIEKDGEIYTGRSPNLIGVSVTAKTRDEAESAIIEAVRHRIDELNTRHNTRMVISDLPVEESIPCLFKADGNEGDLQCDLSAQKDGLCWVHWKKLYSHAFGTTVNLRACPLCGESDRGKLKRWDSPCPFKAENPSWGRIFAEMKIKNCSKWKKEFREIKLEQLGSRARCKEILNNGNLCVNEADRDGLCHRHWWKERKLQRQSEARSCETQSGNAGNIFKKRFRNNG